MSAPKPASAYLDDPNYKSGYMTKQGVRWKTWKRRLFILDIRNKRLSYYQDPQDTIPKGHVGLEGYSVVDDDGVIKKPFSFLLIKDGSRTYPLVCDDESSKVKWMADIKSTLEPPMATMAIDDIKIVSPFQIQGAPTFPMEFIINLQAHGRVWTVTYKYQDFVEFHSRLAAEVPVPALPPRSLVDSRNMQEVFQAQGALKSYLSDLVYSANVKVPNHPLLRRFLNYTDPPSTTIQARNEKQGVAKYFEFEIKGIPMEGLLHTAALRGNLEAIKEIMTMGVDVNAQNRAEHFHSALSGASQNGRTEVLRFLLDHPNINVNIRNGTGATSLFMACQSNKEEAVQILLADKRVVSGIPDGNGCSPIFAAAQFGFWGIVKRLVRHPGVDVNQKMIDGRLPLWQSTRNMRILSMAELFASGRLLDLKGSYNDISPMDLLMNLEQFFPTFPPEHMARVASNRKTMATWFRRYYSDPAGTCAMIRRALGRPVSDLEKFLDVQLSVSAQSIPHTFPTPGALKELVLADSCLLSFPQKLYLCTGLVKLDIRDNLLLDLPVDFFPHFPALLSLDISGNPIQEDFPWEEWFMESNLNELIFHEGQFGDFIPNLSADLYCRPRVAIEGRLQLVATRLREKKKDLLTPPISFNPVPETQHIFWVGDSKSKHLEHLRKTYSTPAAQFHVVSTVDEIANILQGSRIRFSRIILVGQQGQILASQIAALEERTFSACQTFIFSEDFRLQQPFFVEFCLLNGITHLGSTLEELIEFCSGSPADSMIKRYLSASEATLKGQRFFYSLIETGSIKQQFSLMKMTSRSGKDLKEIFLREGRLRSDFVDYRFGGTSTSLVDSAPSGEFNFISTAEFGKELYEALGCVLPSSLPLWRDKICESLTLFWINQRSAVKDAEFLRIIRPLLIPDEKISVALFNAALFYIYSLESFFYHNMARVFATRKYDEVIYFKYFVNYFMELLFSRQYDQYTNTVYRGFAVSEDQKAAYAPGMEIFFLGFASCSKGRAKPEQFASMRKAELERTTGKRFYKVVLEITPLQNDLLARLPALPHTNVDLENFSAIPGEKEVLYPPMATFVIERVEVDEATCSIRIFAKDSRNQCFGNFFTTVSRGLREIDEDYVTSIAPFEFDGEIAFHQALEWFRRDWNANNPDDPVSFQEKSGGELATFITLNPHNRSDLAVRFCENGNLHQLRHWWEQGPSPSAMELANLLVTSCTSDHGEIARFLISEKKADPNGANSQGQTPLWAACRSKRLEMVQFLLTLPQVDVNETVDDGSTPFFVSCERGCLEIAQILATNPRVFTEIYRSNGDSPGMVAARGGHLEILTFLFEKLKHDPNYCVPEGETALGEAVHSKHLRCVEYFLGLPNIDVNSGDLGPLVLALANGDPPVVRTLVEKGCAKVHPILLCLAIKKKDTKITAILLQDPTVDVATNQKGYSPFQMACLFGDAGAVQTMIPKMQASGINAEMPETECTGFQAACQQGHVSVVLELLGDIRVRVSGSLTAAICLGQFLIIEILIKSNRFTRDEVQGEVKTGLSAMMRAPLEATHRVQVKQFVRALLGTVLGSLSDGSFRELLKALE